MDDVDKQTAHMSRLKASIDCTGFSFRWQQLEECAERLLAECSFGEAESTHVCSHRSLAALCGLFLPLSPALPFLIKFAKKSLYASFVPLLASCSPSGVVLP